MSGIEHGSMVKVVSTRFGGMLRDCYEAQLIDYSNSVVRLYVPADTLVFGPDDGPGEPAEVATIEIYFTNRWYNVIHFAERILYNNYWYSNVSKPAQFDGTTLSWVDLDVDVSKPEIGPLKIHDEDEFHVNIRLKGYPSELVTRVFDTRDEVLQLGKLGEFPFDHAHQIVLIEEFESS
jgi:protein associated with RNAse G/E